MRIEKLTYEELSIPTDFYSLVVICQRVQNMSPDQCFVMSREERATIEKLKAGLTPEQNETAARMFDAGAIVENYGDEIVIRRLPTKSTNEVEK